MCQSIYELLLKKKEVNVTVLGLVGGAPWGETPRVADSCFLQSLGSLLVSYGPLAKDEQHCQPHPFMIAAGALTVATRRPNQVSSSRDPRIAPRAGGHIYPILGHL